MGMSPKNSGIRRVRLPNHICRLLDSEAEANGMKVGVFLRYMITHWLANAQRMPRGGVPPMLPREPQP